MIYEPESTLPENDSPPQSGDISIGSITASSHFVIGNGARLIINQALSAAEVAERQKEYENKIVAEAVAKYVKKLRVHLTSSKETAELLEPYKALLPYRLADAPVFFGRERATAQLLKKVEGAGRITVLHSGSGAGKTSLLQAGLAAHFLANQHLPLYVRPWRHLPTETIKLTLIPDLDPGQTPTLAKASLRAFLTQVTAVLGSSSALFILIDQFEEFFIRLQDRKLRTQFVEELGECVDDDTLRARFVLSLRDDHFANLSDFRARIPTIFNNEYALKLLTREEATNAIIKPAENARLDYEDGVVDEILDELQKDEQPEIMPAQLQLVCWALYQEVSETGQTITRAALQRMGGVPAILGNYLKRVIDKEFAHSQRGQARQVLEALVRSDRTRDIKTAVELADRAGPAETLPEVLGQLVDSRLLHVIENENSDEPAAYELTHDYLVPQIELDPETLARKAAQELLDQEVEAWKRNPELRIGDEKLRIIKVQEKKLVFSPEAQELYRLSKRDQRRRRGFLYGFFGAAFLGILGAIIFFRFWTDAEARRATAEIAAQAAETRQIQAENAANLAEVQQATAQSAATTADIARAEAKNAEATAKFARQEAEAGQQIAEAAEGTAVAARNVAETLQAQARQNEAEAISAQQMAQAGEAAAQTAEARASIAQQTAQAGQATAQSNQAMAQASEATAQARQVEAEAAAQQAAEAQAAAEAARAQAEQARSEAEEAARQAEAEKKQAEEAAQEAEATRAAAEALRDEAEADLAQTQQLAAMIRNTHNCSVASVASNDSRPEAVAYDGDHLWVINKGTEEVAKLNAGDCSFVGSYPIGNGPSDIIYGGGFIWVAEQLDNKIRKIDPSTGNTILPLFEAGPPGGRPTALLYVDGVLWVTSTSFDGNQNKLRKIDPHNGQNLATTNTGRSPADLIWAAGYIWVANRDDHSISKIDPATGQTIQIFEDVGGLKPTALIYDGSDLWVANQASSNVVKLRIDDGQILFSSAVGKGPDALAFDGVNIWSANEDHSTLTRISAADGAHRLDVPTAREPTAILYDGANIWIVAELGNLLQKIPVNIYPVGQEPVALAAQGNAIWVANREDKTLTKISTLSHELPETIKVVDQPVALTPAGAHVWVGHGNSKQVSKIAEDGRILGIFSINSKAQALTFDGTYIWVITQSDNKIMRLRERDGTVTDVTQLGDELVDILYDGSHIWVADTGAQLLRKLDSTANQILASAVLEGSPQAVTSNGTYLWVSYLDFTAFKVKIQQVDAANGSIVDTILTEAEFGSSTLHYAGNNLWLTAKSGTNATVGEVIRINPQAPTDQITFHVCSEPPVDLLGDGNGVWVACQGDDLVQKLVGDNTVPSNSTLKSASFIKPGLHLYLPVILVDH